MRAPRPPCRSNPLKTDSLPALRHEVIGLRGTCDGVLIRNPCRGFLEAAAWVASIRTFGTAHSRRRHDSLRRSCAMNQANRQFDSERCVVVLPAPIHPQMAAGAPVRENDQEAVFRAPLERPQCALLPKLE